MPTPAMPVVTWNLLWDVLPAALSFTLLGGVESLLPSALVLLTTFCLTLLEDLTVGIVAGCCVAATLAVLRRPVSEEGDQP